MSNETTIKILNKLTSDQRAIIKSNDENIKELLVQSERIEQDIDMFVAMNDTSRETIGILSDALESYRN